MSAENPKRRIIAESEKMKAVLALVKKVAPLNTIVLITGETGVGKDVIAQAIHEGSPRKDKPFEAYNCGAPGPLDLVDGTLFGHKKGAFTGADEERKGLFKQADGGTLFLDEVGEMSLEMQVKFLRVLEDKVIRSVGRDKGIPVNVRIIAATNKDLDAAIKKGTFRPDLYQRLALFPIHIPPLRCRCEDIPPLVNASISELSTEIDKPITVTGITPRALKYLEAFLWPGNVRQLKHNIERAIILSENEMLDVGDFPGILETQGIQDAAPIGPELNNEPEDSRLNAVSSIPTTYEIFKMILTILETWEQQADSPLNDVFDETPSATNLKCLSVAYVKHRFPEFNITALANTCAVARATFNQFNQSLEANPLRQDLFKRIQEAVDSEENQTLR